MRNLTHVLSPLWSGSQGHLLQRGELDAKEAEELAGLCFPLSIVVDRQAGLGFVERGAQPVKDSEQLRRIMDSSVLKSPHDGRRVRTLKRASGSAGSGMGGSRFDKKAVASAMLSSSTGTFGSCSGRTRAVEQSMHIGRESQAMIRSDFCLSWWAERARVVRNSLDVCSSLGCKIRKAGGSQGRKEGIKFGRRPNCCEYTWKCRKYCFGGGRILALRVIVRHWVGARRRRRVCGLLLFALLSASEELRFVALSP
jgi:hypothetical protein